VNQSSPYKSSYRSEIDGLRAFAVLSVVVFHIAPTWLNGVFIGVDVFFVISGFLITSHIFENLDKGKFSFTDFFGRRIRRIFPALILVMACSLAFGWFALIADEYAQLGKHVASGAAFISNFILVDESGYFDNVAETKPMLHLWSLAVEEQFYIVWPLVLWLAWKRKFNLLTITVLFALVSFYLNLRFVKSYPTETFFWPIGRFWELLSGSILAWLLLYKSDCVSRFKLWVDKCAVRFFQFKDVETNGNIASNLMSIVGLFLLAYSVLRINESLPFPSFWALIPVLGALLIIVSGSKAWLNRILLMNPIAIWFGLISYPLYLWHWPIISFLHIIEDGVPSRLMRINGVISAIILAWLTYQFVEKPIRFGLNKIRRTAILLGAMVSIGFIGLQIYSSNKSVISPTAATAGESGHNSFFSYLNSTYHKCENLEIYNSSNKWRGLNRCWQSKKGEPTVILLGDSHAENYFIGFAETLKEENVAFYIEGGRPSLNDAEFRVIFEQLSNVNGDGKTVVITTFYGQDFGKHDLLNELKEVIQFLKSLNFRVVIIGDVPVFSSDPRSCISDIPINKLFNRQKVCDISKSDLASQIQLYEPHLQLLAFNENVIYLPTNNNLICDNTKCSMKVDGQLLYRDSHHLNVLGSKLMGGDFATRIFGKEAE